MNQVNDTIYSYRIYSLIFNTKTIFMKRLYFAVIVLLLLGQPIIAQETEQQEEVLAQSLMISIKKHGAKNSEYIVKSGLEAEQFNIEKYLKENLDHADIRILGKVTSYGKTIKINFDSKKLNQDNECQTLCKKITSVSKMPLLGLSAVAMDDLKGLTVERVFEGSAADIAGIEQGDIITFVGDSIMQSGCDLTVAVGGASIGEVLDIHLEDDNEKEILPIVLGYKVVENVTYEYCCPENISLEIGNQVSSNNQLTVFPNPTDGLTQLRFYNFETGNLEINMTDVAGQVIYNRSVKEFSGVFHESFDLTNYPSGMYFIQVVQGNESWTEKVVLQTK